MKHGIGKTIRNNILFGALIITPVVVTIIVLKWLFTMITDVTLTFVPKAIWEHNVVLFRIGALVLELAVVFLIGALVRNIIGKRLYQFAERFVTSIPLMNKVYVAIRQILESFLSDRKSKFSEVVSLDYPHPGIKSLGFVTGTVPADVVARMPKLAEGDEYVAVFVPTAPNPTTGWLCMIERSKVTPLPMSPGEGMKIIVSAGAAFQENAQAGTHEPTFLDKLDSWMAKQGGVENCDAVASAMKAAGARAVYTPEAAVDGARIEAQ